MKKIDNVKLSAPTAVVWRISAVIAVLAAFACEALAWDVEHDEVAQLTGEFLPKEVKETFDFDDFAILMANCHFPDMTEWPCENGSRRYHTLGELASHVGEENARVFAELGFNNSNWFHTPKGRATLMSMLARAFGRGDHASAAFCISVLTHAVSDEGALNHPPLLGFFRYSKLPGIDFTMRKVEDGAKNVFGFRSDGHVVHLVRERMKDYVPQVPASSFEDALLSLGVEVAVIHGAKTGEIEGAIAFAPQQEAERALVDLVYRQVCALEDIVWTCWTHRSPDAALPGADFNRVLGERAFKAARSLDPRRQYVFNGIFDESLNPANAKATVGIVCDAYAREYGTLSFPGRILSAAAGRTLRANGYAVKGIAYWEAAKGLPDPSEVPVVLVCIGGAGYMSHGVDASFAAAAKEYRRRGGKLIVVGGEDGKDITGFAATMKRRDNKDVPVSSAWHRSEAADACSMALVATGLMPRLKEGRYPFFRDPNFDGFCKPVCRMETPAGDRLLELDNGRERFAVAVRKDGVVWLPEYAIFPYLFVKDDPKLPLDALTLDDFGSKVLLDAVESLLGVSLTNENVVLPAGGGIDRKKRYNYQQQLVKAKRT